MYILYGNKKRVFEAAKFAYAKKTKEPVTSRKLVSQEFCQIANSVLNKGKSAIPPLFISPEGLSSASDNAKLFAKTFLRTVNFLRTLIKYLRYPFSLLQLI